MATTTQSGDGPIELQKTAKRDYLQKLEKDVQARWASERIFDIDAPASADLVDLSPDEIRAQHPKFMGTFPYPYMNGSLHLGHAFSISKIEFATGYQRMLGKRALFPMGFHCTGMPIKAAADKLVREMELFGEDFSGYGETTEPEPAKKTGPVVPAPEDKVDKAKKGKVAAKSTGLTYQFQIMESIGVPRSEIPKFANPSYWLEYFPPIAIADCTSLGARIDWRRSFITTDVNPYYDAFVRWQMNKLHTLQKIKFGKRYTIYSVKDGQPCMDHDRASGEGVGPQEYTGIKMQVTQWSENVPADVKAKLEGKKVFLVAATLRPETMYGQTNCFVGPTLDYGIFAVSDDEVYVCTERAARNMAFQGISQPEGEVRKMAALKGESIVGTKIKAPFSIYDEVWVLPMEGVLATKGTGVVTSVPSDSPDDFATLTDLKKKPEFYKIDPSWAAFEPVPVLSTPTYGDLTAPALVKKFKIQSQKDAKQLAEAKEIAYKEGFYGGTMVVGEFKGLPVQEAKPKVRDSMVEKGLAFVYSEPEGQVMSRSGDECIVALCDQWYLDYGEAEWKAQAELLLKRMNTYFPETRNQFEGTLAWLNQWACARSFGLGSKLPWDPQFLVESLSDSTIYMAYYTVAHLLQGSVDGKTVGPLGIKAEQLTDAIFDYLFVDGPFPESSPIPREKVDKLKREFSYFYPMDVRSSGKDLIPNHLTFSIYNHAAIFPEHNWPLSMRANGHLMLNGKKMSKSTGNSLTLRDAVEKFGADATRLTLADAGDGIEDANFEEKTANAAILRLHTLIEWCEEMVKNKGQLRSGPRDTFHDKAFQHELNALTLKTKAAYDATFYKEALKEGFYELQTARDWYREVTADIGMHVDLVLHFIRLQALLILPIAPHFAEQVWTHVLGEQGSVQNARFPEITDEIDQSVLDALAYIRSTVKDMRDAEILLGKKKKGKAAASAYDDKKPKALRIFVAKMFPAWQEDAVAIVREAYDDKTGAVNDAKVRQILNDKGLLKDKRFMPFIQAFKKRIAQFGAVTAFNRTLPFSEVEVLQIVSPYIKHTLGLTEISVEPVDAQTAASETDEARKRIIEQAEPGNPGSMFYNL